MNCKLDLGNNGSFDWRRLGNAHYVCTATARAQIEAALCLNLTPSDLGERLSCIPGCFSLVIEQDDCVILAGDIAGGFPLLYSSDGQGIAVSDNASAAAPARMEIRPLAAAEFRMATYVSDGETLLAGLRQIRPGEIVVIGKADGSTERHDYWSFATGKSHHASTEEYDRILHEVFTDLGDALGGRRVYLPLSGGLDSRTVAVMLRRVGYDNVSCFSYGRKGSFESETARAVARALGYEFSFLEYTADDWESFYESRDWDGFLSYAFSFCRTACVQPTMAVARLARKPGDGERGVVIPGHISYNSAVPLEALCGKALSRDKVAELFLGDEYVHDVMSVAERAALLEKVTQGLGLEKGRRYKPSEWLPAFWNLGWRGSQTQFYNHDVRSYEYYGFEWEMPFWDVRVADYWKAVAPDQAFRRRLYHEYCERWINPHVGLHTAIPDSSRFPRVMAGLKKVAPEALLRMRRSIISKKDLDVHDCLGWETFLKQFALENQTFNSYIAEYSMSRFLSCTDYPGI